jgi:hypothetical protein
MPQKHLSLMTITRTHSGSSVHLVSISLLHIDGNNQHPFRAWCPCWWRSGPKGERRHNSPLNSFPPFGYCYEATSTTRARKGNAERLNNTGKETSKYLVDRRPKDKRMPSVLSSHYSVSVSLQGVHYL